MPNQIKDHLRNPGTEQSARNLARRPTREIELWRRLLREDRERGMKRPETPVEALYDEATGLPV